MRAARAVGVLRPAWYNYRMIKALEQAIQKVRALPEDKQRLAAELLEELAAEPSSFLIPAWHREIVEQRLDEDEVAV